MFKQILRIAVQEAHPVQARGRPPLLSFDDAYDDILRVARTGMQWRNLQPRAGVSHTTVFKTMHKWIASDLFRVAYERFTLKRLRQFYQGKNVCGIKCLDQ